MMQLWRRTITKDQSRDTGMAMVLILLIVYGVTGRKGAVQAAIAVHVVNMTVPLIFKPLAVVWLGLSDLLGRVVSKLLMAVIFFAIVTPIGIFRRALGRDSLNLRAFKGGTGSAMMTRDYQFTASDLERPY